MPARDVSIFVTSITKAHSCEATIINITESLLPLIKHEIPALDRYHSSATLAVSVIKSHQRKPPTAQQRIPLQTSLKHRSSAHPCLPTLHKQTCLPAQGLLQTSSTHEIQHRVRFYSHLWYLAQPVSGYVNLSNSVSTDYVLKALS